MKKQVNIKCVLNNSLEECSYYIFLYYNNKVIYQGYLNSNDFITLRLFTCKNYRLIVLTNKDIIPHKYIADIFLEENTCKNLVFYFLKKDQNLILSNFELLDKHYPDLKIKEGELILWQ